MATVKWINFRSWSGIQIRGENRFSPVSSPPSGWDLVLATISNPEGGCFDTVVSYDGTGMTWGFMQWTITSGRLQKLLAEIDPALYDRSLVPGALLSAKVKLDRKRGILVDSETGKAVTEKDDLRNRFTPPGGKVPKSGTGLETATRIAKAFKDFGLSASVANAQYVFSIAELTREASLKRPQLKDATTASILYVDRIPTPATPIDQSRLDLEAARALFWGYWQNCPRKAEEYLYAVTKGKPVTTRGDLDRLAAKFARSQFGYWGNETCEKLQRTSRYTKHVNVINKMLSGYSGFKALDPKLR